jgi:iron(III) transport system substrate-binding protein
VNPISRRKFVIRGASVLGLSAAFPGILIEACGGSSPSTASDVWTGTAAEMEAKAKKEGSLTLYLGDPKQAKTVLDAFKVAYPWVSTNSVTDNVPTLLNKMITEARAGATVADVILTFAWTAPRLLQANAIKAGSVPNDDLIPAAMRDPKNFFHAYNLTLSPLIYNTNLLKESDVPTDLYQLADPKWRGKFATDSPAVGAISAFVFGSRRALWGDDKWKTWLADVAANKIFIQPDMGSTYAAVLRGEVPLGLSTIRAVLTQPPGTPIKAVWYPSVAPVLLVHLISLKAPHPNTAALFLNWSSTKEGQAAIASTSAIPAQNIGSATDLDKVLPSSVQLMPQDQLEDYYNNLPSYISIYSQYWPA